MSKKRFSGPRPVGTYDHPWRKGNYTNNGNTTVNVSRYGQRDIARLLPGLVADVTKRKP